MTISSRLSYHLLVTRKYSKAFFYKSCLDSRVVLISAIIKGRPCQAAIQITSLIFLAVATDEYTSCAGSLRLLTES